MSSRALGTTLKIDSDTIGNLTSISGIEASAETIDVTTLDSDEGYREFETGFKDAGEVTADGIMKDGGADVSTLTGLLGAESTSSCEIEFPNNAKWTFDGIVTGISTDADVEGSINFSLTIKVSGKPTFTAGT